MNRNRRVSNQVSTWLRSFRDDRDLAEARAQVSGNQVSTWLLKATA